MSFRKTLLVIFVVFILALVVGRVDIVYLEVMVFAIALHEVPCEEGFGEVWGTEAPAVGAPEGSLGEAVVPLVFALGGVLVAAGLTFRPFEGALGGSAVLLLFALGGVLFAAELAEEPPEGSPRGAAVGLVDNFVFFELEDRGRLLFFGEVLVFSGVGEGDRTLFLLRFSSPTSMLSTSSSSDGVAGVPLSARG